MKVKLHLFTVSELLLKVLRKLMSANEFDEFRLVGGTALSLYRGHRKSEDIDLFSDATYGSIDFDAIYKFLKSNFTYLSTSNITPVGNGKTYFIGDSEKNCIKLDLYYTEKFLDKPCNFNNIRIASVADIIAMKIDVISRSGRKKDYWDLHDLIEDYTLEDMLLLHNLRHPYTPDRNSIINNFTNFTYADLDFNPICLKGKYWELIKLDLIELIAKSKLIPGN